MENIDDEILNSIKYLTISCPECEDMWEEDQYQCGTCGCEGAGNEVAVFTVIKDQALEDIDEETLDKIKNLEVDCPECESMFSDDQYTCTTCWCEGGGGKINVFEYLKDNNHFKNK